MNRILLLLFLSGAAGLQAQEATVEPPVTSEQQAGTTEAEETADEEDRELTPEELTPDTFDPTEKVSEDLPVAFPVDI